MKKMLFVASLLIIASMLLAACGAPAAPATEAPAAPAAPAATDAPAAPAATEAPAAPAATEAPTAVPPTPTLTPYPVANCEAGKTCVTWFVGLGTGTDPAQIAVQEEVVKDFNASQDKIQLILEIVPFNAAKDTLSTQIASGAGPDIVGPVGWGGSNAYYGQWLNLSDEIKAQKFDTTVFDPALVKFYQVEGEQVGLPFAVFPGAIYFVPAMFDESGLKYPPQKYGDKYEMPDGTKVDWTWDTMTTVAKMLTIDKNGKNATEEGFDSAQIVQVGYNAQWQAAASVGTFYGGAAKVFEGAKKGEYKSALPESWKAGWKWYYDGMWGKQPFIPTGALGVWTVLGYGDELIRWSDANVLSNPKVSDIQRGHSLTVIGRLCYTKGDVPESIARYRAASELAHRIEDEELILEADQYLGFLTLDDDISIRLLNAVIALAHQTERKSRESLALSMLGARLRLQGNLNRAHSALTESVRLARKTGNSCAIAGALGPMGRLLLEQGNYPEARAVLEESILLNRQEGLRGWLGYDLENLAEVGLGQGDGALVKRLLPEIIPYYHQIDDLGRVARGLTAAAGLAQLRGQLAPAVRLLGAASAIRREHHTHGIFESDMSAEYNRRLPALRAVLAQADFETAWAEGQALSLHQAIALALTA